MSKLQSCCLALALALVGAGLGGCATVVEPLGADDFYVARDFDRAVPAYVEYLGLEPLPADADRALFRLAVCHSLLGDAAEPMRTEELLRELVERYPDSAYRPAADLILELWGDLEQLRGDVLTYTDLIGQLVQGSLSQQERFAEVEGRQTKEIELLDAQFSALSRRFRERLAELEALRAENQRLHDELEELKRIDTKLSNKKPIL